MSRQPYDELSARRSRRRPVPVDHRTRLEFASLTEVLCDADRLLVDLETIGEDALLIPLADVEFTARRLRQMLVLIRAEVARVEQAAP